MVDLPMYPHGFLKIEYTENETGRVSVDLFVVVLSEGCLHVTPLYIE